MFHVPLGNTNNTEMHNFDPHVPGIQYVRDDKNTYVLSGMGYSLFDENGNVSEHYVVSWLSSYLSCETVGFMNRIRFATKILTDCVRNNGK